MSLRMPNPRAAESLAVVVVRLKNDKIFALDFATEVKSAMGGNQDAMACVVAYFQPTDQELTSFGIPVVDQPHMRSCTDVSVLVLVKCKEAAPAVFP